MNDQIFSTTGSDWIISLSGEYGTNWGDIDGFYNDISKYDDYERDENFVYIKTDINVNDRTGTIKFLDKNEKKYPSKGDGLAFYHSYRATRNGKQIKKPQISLIGKFIEAHCQEGCIKSLKAKITYTALEAFYQRPILREENRELFEECQIISGTPHTLYQVSEQLWDQLIQLAKEVI